MILVLRNERMLIVALKLAAQTLRDEVKRLLDERAKAIKKHELARASELDLQAVAAEKNCRELEDLICKLS